MWVKSKFLGSEFVMKGNVPFLGATGPYSRWEGLSTSMNLQAVLTVLVTVKVSNVRVVASKMPD